MKIIKNGLLVTMDSKRRVIEDGAVAIEGKFIKEVGKTKSLCAKWPDAESIDATGHMILPGFINAHTHLFQVLLRGIGDDLSLTEWLKKAVWPLSKYVGREESYLATLLASAEMLSSGITTFVDSHYITIDKKCYDGIAQAVEEIGNRGVIGRSTVDSNRVPSEFRETVSIAVKEAHRVIETYHQKVSGRLTVRVEPLNEALASKEMILAMRKVSRDYGVGFSMHAGETKDRSENCNKNYGYPTIEWLYKIGVLGPDVLLAHCVWVNSKEIDLLYKTGTKVVHNPLANQYLGDGIAPIRKMIDKGVTIAIATDGAATNNSQNIFEAMKSAALLQKVTQLNAGAFSAQKALEMVTIDAAQAIGMEDKIGSLEKEKIADLILINLEIPQLVPLASVLSNIVYAAPTNAVDIVMVNGRIIFKKGEVITFNQKQLVKRCNEKTKSILRSVGINGLVNRGNWKIQ